MAVTSTVGYISHMMLKEPLRSEAIEVLPPMDGQYLLTLGEPLIKSVTTPPPRRGARATGTTEEGKNGRRIHYRLHTASNG